MVEIVQSEELALTLDRDLLLKPLNLVANLADRKQTLEVLSNLLFKIEGRNLSLISTDTEVELICRLILPTPFEGASDVVIPAKKLWEICKSLPGGASLRLKVKGHRLSITSGNSRFALSMIVANEFPSFVQEKNKIQLTVERQEFHEALSKAHYAMGEQDVRYYLNGMLFTFNNGLISLMSTDGHRLMSTKIPAFSKDNASQHQALVPRKAILELLRLLGAEGEESLQLIFGDTSCRVIFPHMEFTSRLIDGQIPDYRKVVPDSTDVSVEIDRQELRDVLSRVSILSNEKVRGVKLCFHDNCLKLTANNPDREQAEDQLAIEYQGEKLPLAFNVTYLLDALNAIDTPTIIFHAFSSGSGSIVIRPKEGNDKESEDAHVIMPMCL
jgi:DNA polymerase-3 subunit beta